MKTVLILAEWLLKKLTNHCSNRIAYKKLHVDDMRYNESENFRKTNQKKLLEYKEELVTLDSLLKIN